MFSNISPLGWILIIGLAAFIIALNLGLLFGAKQKMEKDNWIEKLTNAGEAIKHPLKKEDERYRALAEEVAKFKSTGPIDPTDEKSNKQQQGEK